MSATAPAATGHVPLVRLASEPPELQQILAEVERVARHAAFTLGPEVEAFEQEFAAYCGARHAVGVSSGTDALALALLASGVGAGDDVVVPANTFIATAEAVSMTGATPVFADVDPVTHLMTAETLEAAITRRTRAVIPVHLYGRTLDIGPIRAVADPFGAAIVEDACQAHGAAAGGRRAGALGDCGCFSFYPSKNLGAWGDGGAVVTDDPGLADRVRLLRSHGGTSRHEHLVPGTTARLDAVQAAVLRVKLRRLDHDNLRRRRLATMLSSALAGTSVTPPAAIGPAGDHVFHQYVVTCPQRDALRRHLDRLGISTAVHYPVPVHRTPAYAGPGRPALPHAESLAASVCSLPMHPGLSVDEVSRIAAAVRSFDPPVAA